MILTPHSKITAPLPIKDSTQTLSISGNVVITRKDDNSPRSYLKDLTWDYTSEVESAIHLATKVNFEHINEAIRLDIQKTLYLYNKYSPASVSTIISRKGTLCRIAECLGSADWSKLDLDTNYRKFKKKLKLKRYGITAAGVITACLTFLYEIGLTTRILNKNFKKNIICENKKTKTQYMAIPEKMASKLFCVAMDIVEKYHPHRHDISNAYSEAISCRQDRIEKSKSIKVMSKYLKKINHSIPDFNLCFMYSDGIQIQLACLLVLQGFSGVRLGESISFNKNSYFTIPFSDKYDIPLLKGKHSKPNKYGKATTETWVTHPIAEKAIELAYDMSNYARKIYIDKIEDYEIDIKKSKEREIESAFILLKATSQKNRFILTASSLGLFFRKFGKTHNITASQEDVEEYDILNPTRKGTLKLGGFLPKLSPHDFRRTFAVFLVRNKLGNLMALRHQYKHLNTFMTAWYANNANLMTMLDFEKDSEMIQMVKEANEELNTDIIYNIYNETESLSGKEGGRIAKLREEYSGLIYMSRDEIRRQVHNGSLSIVEHPTGYCSRPTCDRICATETSSITCQHEIVTREKAESRIPIRERLIKKFNALNDEKSYMASILTQMYTGIKAIELTLGKHGIDFIPFEAEIKSQSISMIEVL